MNGMMTFHSRASKLLQVLAAALLVLSVGCSESRLSPAERLASIDKDWQAGHVSSALIALKNATGDNPDDAQLRHRLADMYLLLGNAESAAAEIEKGVKAGLDQRTAEVLNIRAAVLRNDFDVALTKFETNTDIAADPRLRALHAEILGLIGKLDQAQQLYQEALKDPQPSPAALQGMARIFMVRNELKPAREFLDKALVAEAWNWNNFMFDAELRETEADFAGAHKALDTAARLNPFVIFPALAQVRLDLREQKFDSAKLRLVELEKRAGKNLMVAYYKAIVAYAADDFVVAEDSFRQVLSKAPNHAQSLLYMGYLTYRKGNLEQAENFLTVYRQLAPDFEPAQKLLASIQLKRLRPEEALKTLGEPTSDADSEMLGLKASAYFAAGNAEAGLSSLQAAAARAPEDESLKSALALATARLGKVDEAIALLEPDAPVDKQLTQKDTMLLYLYMTRKEWDKIIELGAKMHAVKGDDPGLLNALASAYVGKNELPKAVELLKRAVAASPETPTLVSNLALLLMRQGDLAGAQPYVDQLLQIDGTDGANLTLAAVAADAKGDAATAIGLYERVRVSNPLATEARLALSSHYVRAQNYAKTVEVAGEILRLMPRNLGAMIDLGHGLRGQGKLQMAENVAHDALRIAPDSPKAQFLLGSVLLERGRFADAEKELRRARGGLPDAPEVTVALVRALTAKGGATDLSEAETLLNELSKGETGSAAVSGLRGELASAKGDFATAAAAFAAALEQDDSDGWALRQAVALARGGQLESAVELLKARSAARPKSTEVLLLLAQLERQLKRDQQAVSTYQKVLALDPNHVMALNNLALLELDMGLKDALEHAKAAYELDAENPQVADTYGWILFKRGKSELAQKIMAAAAKAAQNDASIQFHYAVILVGKGDKREAAGAIARALGQGEFPERKLAEQLAAELTR